MIDLTRRETYWQKWCRGFERLVRAVLDSYVYIVVPTAAFGVVKFLPDLPGIRVPAAVAIAIGLLIAMPFVAAWDDRRVRATEAETRASREGIDAIADYLELDIQNDWLGEVAELLRRGEHETARRLLYNKTQANWDDVDIRIEHWPETVMRRKIALIVEKLREGKASKSNPAGELQSVGAAGNVSF